MSQVISGQIRPQTAYTQSPHSTQSLIDSIYQAESSIFTPKKLSQTPCTPMHSIPKTPKRLRIRKTSQVAVSQLLTKELIQKSSPKHRRKFSHNEIYQIREIRCRALNTLMNACCTVGDSKGFHKVVDKELRFVNEWSRKMDKVTANLVKLAEYKQEYIESFYYLDKTSNEDILKDILRIKNGKEQVLVVSKKRNKRRASLEFG